MITIECPHCYEPLSIPESLERIKCPNCGKASLLSYDAEYLNGMWHDLTSITPELLHETSTSN